MYRIVSQKMRLERDQENPKTWNSDGERDQGNPKTWNSNWTACIVWFSDMLLIVLCADWLKDAGALVENYIASPLHPHPTQHRFYG